MKDLDEDLAMEIRSAISARALALRPPPLRVEVKRVNAPRRRMFGVVSAVAGAAAALVVGLMLATSGPTATPQPSAQNPGGSVITTGPTAGRGHIEASRIKTYGTVAALTADTPLVAYVTATDQAATINLNGLPFTTRQVTVDRIVRGAAPGPTIAVRELGRPGDDTSLVSGKHYLVFLAPFEMKPGEPTGEWIVVGVYAGVWEVSASTVVRLDPESTDLPSELTVAEMDSQVRPVGG